MKSITLIAIILIPFGMNAQKTMTVNDLDFRNELYYQKNASRVFSGKLVTWYSNGQVESCTLVKKGTKKDKMKIFYDSGKLRTILFENKNHVNYGKIRSWNEDGTLAFKGRFENGRLYQKGTSEPFSGETICKYFDGTTYESDNFKEGYWNGNQTRWNRNGEIIFECIFMNNQIIDCPVYNK